MLLEIGPGETKLGPEWVTVSAAPGAAVDYLAEWGWDRLPFSGGTVSELYASHVIEHVPWFRVDAALMEAWRVLAPLGEIELHSIDASALMRDYLAGTMREGVDGHPLTAVASRVFSHPRNAADRGCVQWHKSLMDPMYLRWALQRCGFGGFWDVAEPRGPEKHGPYSFGIRAVKC